VPVLVVETAAPSGVARALEGAGYAVDRLTGSDAVDQAAARMGGPQQPSAVIFDGAVASQAIEQLKQRAHGHVPLVVVGATDAAGRAAALRAGADDSVGQFVEPGELVARVEAHLRTARAFVKATAPVMPAAERAGARIGMRRVKEEFQRAERYKEPLSLMIAAADGKLSAAQRPAWLVEVAAHLERVVRAQDLMVREADDDLMVLLPNTHFVGSLSIAERALREIGGRELPVPTGGSVRCELWIGAACFPGRDIVSADDLLRMARSALERARREDAGRVCIYQYQGYIYQPM